MRGNESASYINHYFKISPCSWHGWSTMCIDQHFSPVDEVDFNVLCLESPQGTIDEGCELHCIFPRCPALLNNICAMPKEADI